jgi:hypothetical protein
LRDSVRTGAHIEAAIAILDDVLNRHRPAPAALADWGKSHRFAGSSDRASIGNLVYDALRRQHSLAARMGSDRPRALALAAAPRALGLTVAATIASADGSPHAISPLSEAEITGLTRELPADAPASVRGDYPDWLAPSFARAFGEAAAEEGAALARRAPVDLRVNTLKADRDRVITPYSPLGVRLPAPHGPARQPNVEAEVGHGRGWFEIQDEGSQITALMANARPREQVLDICAGSGGKTLLFAASMRNTGQIYAYDEDPLRLRPILERLKRAGVRNTQVLAAGDAAGLAATTRRQVAPEDRQSRAAPGAAEECARRGRRPRQGRWPPRVRHLLAAAGRERRPDCRLPHEPSGLSEITLAHRMGVRCRWRAARLGKRTRPRADASASWHGRLLHRDARVQTVSVARARRRRAEHASRVVVHR